MRLLFVALALSLSLSAASSAAQTDTGSAPRLHVYSATSDAYDANAFWIEGADGLVLVDALLKRSDARGLVAAMKATGKPLTGVFLTHPHADHFGGLPTVRAAWPDVPVYATRATAEGVAHTHEGGMGPNGWLTAYGDEYDHAFVTPDHIVASGDTVRLAGMVFVVRDYGPMEAEDNAVVWAPGLGVLFTGDATVEGAEYYVGEGHSAEALAALPKILADFPEAKLAYSGHYGALDLETLVEENAARIRMDRAATRFVMADSANMRPDGMLTQTAARELVRLLASAGRGRPSYGVGPVTMASLNAGGLIREMADERRGGATVPAPTRAAMEGMLPLRYLLGRWEGETPAGAGGPGVVAFTLSESGLAFETLVQSAGYRYRITISWDAAQGQFRAVAIDDISGLQDVFEAGPAEDGTVVFDNTGPGTFYRDGSGREVHNRMTFAPTETGWTWVVEASTAGGPWMEQTRFTAHRRLVP